LIDDDGCFTKEAGDEFSGLDVLNDGANKILQHINEDVLHSDTITHSYPYDWRSKKPVIIRASHQWFIDIRSIKENTIVSQPVFLEQACYYAFITHVLMSFFTQGQYREYKNISGAKSDVVFERVDRSS